MWKWLAVAAVAIGAFVAFSTPAQKAEVAPLSGELMKIVSVQPDAIDANSPYPTELRDIKLTAFALKCGRVSEAAASSTYRMLAEDMYRLASPETNELVPNAEVDRLVHKAQRDGIALAPVACDWWNSNPGHTEQKKIASNAL